MKKRELIKKLQEAEEAGDHDTANQILLSLAELKRKQIAKAKRFIALLAKEH